jgi:hypothetical protein
MTAPTARERAKMLVGDMPWVTEHLTPKQLADLPKQIGTSIEAAEREAVAKEREACLKIAETPSDKAFLRRLLISERKRLKEDIEEETKYVARVEHVPTKEAAKKGIVEMKKLAAQVKRILKELR